MAYYSKTLENISNISLPNYRGSQKHFADCVSVTYGTVVHPSTAATSCVPGSSGGLNLPSLAPIQVHELEPHMINVTSSEDHQEREPESGAFYGQREQDRKVRREIANSNERRRMQSINAGFKSLKTILPHADGDKLSKAAILQQTAEYIFQLESDKLKLLNQNEKLRRACAECSSPKHRAFLTDFCEKDEGIGSPREEDLEDMRRDSIEVRQQLDKERRMRLLLEEKVREFESHLAYPEKLRELASDVVTHHRAIQSRQPVKEEQPIRAQLQTQAENVQMIEHSMIYVPATQTTVPSPPHPPTQAPLIIEQPLERQHPQNCQYDHVTAVEPVPSAALCVTLGDTAEVTSRPTQQALPGKPRAVVPRSRQPLKKRAIEVDEVDAQVKVAKVCSAPRAIQSPPGNPPLTPLSPTTSVIAPNPARNAVNHIAPEQPISVPHVAEYRLVAPSNCIKMTGPEMAAVSSERLQSLPKSMTSELPPVQYHVHQGVVVSPPTEPTLNRLNTLPSISMTLTQLNALPINTPPAPLLTPPAPLVTPAMGPARVHAQLLPVVAMDTVLSRRNERRISSATTESVASDEDCRMSEDQIQDPKIKTQTPSSENPPQAPTTQPCPNDMPVLSPTVVSPGTTLSVLGNGPGSPTLLRHIDAAATRRNLETIVQAIDHLEQQERRNSQDTPLQVVAQQR